MKLNGKNVPLHPIVSVPKYLKADVVANIRKQLKKSPTVISLEDMGTVKRQHRRHSMPATSVLTLNTMERFDKENEQDTVAQAQEESMLLVLESLK